MLLALSLPSFDTVIHNYRKSFLRIWSKHSNNLVKLLRCVCPSVFLWVLLCFIVQLVLHFLCFTYTACLSVCMAPVFMFMRHVAWFKSNDDDNDDDWPCPH